MPKYVRKDPPRYNVYIRATMRPVALDQTLDVCAELALTSAHTLYMMRYRAKNGKPTKYIVERVN